ncbi:hypothetical protein EV11_1308 [Prochlorococcus sp. SS52]|nr:hypothetical protein EV04_0067 [Prochlorococcus marinus str. LG]KGG22212.1 hypothetical protein EV08_0388 [Prochlorococcus marinus str. SS2]KGG24471.1 hypothetical protein EV09_0101 [Prochlorococcus marinus str. SS35]KGG33366.1 hypothetical protein EV10_0573 [Prochlorococcus marinus str. SS51]KGG35507.1 hypothetical protein EV11_1308 [Prochlorococcus sp. SS52]
MAVALLPMIKSWDFLETVFDIRRLLRKRSFEKFLTNFCYIESY